MCPRKRVEIGQEYLKAQRKRQSCFSHLPTNGVSQCTIRGKPGGKRICCGRFRREHAHVEQERPELCRLGNRRSLKVRRRLLQPTAKHIQKKKRPSMSKNWISSRHHGYSYEWTSGQKPQLIRDGIRIKCNTVNFEPIGVPGSSTSSSSSATPTSSNISNVQEAEHPASTRSESSSITAQYGETRRMNHHK